MSARSERFYWASHTSPDLAALVDERTIAVLPVGAIEQHGPHLPLGVDADIVRGLVAAVVEKLDAAESSPRVLFLPTMAIGKSSEHEDFAGTLSLSAGTLMRVWSEIAASVARAGVRRMVFFNSHGGQVAPMEIVARDTRIKHNMLTVACNWFALGLPEGLIGDHESTFGIHAGELETSMMLALHPHRCIMERAENFVSEAETIRRQSRQLASSAGGRLGWKMGDLNRAGACGNAAAATVQTGSAAIDYVADRFIELLHDVHAFSLDRLERVRS